MRKKGTICRVLHAVHGIQGAIKVMDNIVLIAISLVWKPDERIRLEFGSKAYRMNRYHWSTAITPPSHAASFPKIQIP
eukprot:gene28390-31526_t